MNLAMKLFVVILLLSAGVADAADVDVRVMRHGAIGVAPQDSAFISNVIALLASCSVDSTSYVVTPDTWRQALRTDSFVLVKFPSSRQLNVMSSENHALEPRAIDEILVPLPEGKWPAHIFARSGTDVLSFTKYHPRELGRVALDPALELSSVPPYKDLDKILNKSE